MTTSPLSRKYWHPLSRFNRRKHTGHASPIKRGTPAPIELDKAAREKNCSEIGIQGVNKLSAYIGTTEHLRRVAQFNIEELVAALSSDRMLECIAKIRQWLADSGRVASFFVLDDAAEGWSIAKEMPLVLSVQVASQENDPAEDASSHYGPADEVISMLWAIAEEAVGRKVFIVNQCLQSYTLPRLELFKCHEE